jgi:hypothetical protein
VAFAIVGRGKLVEDWLRMPMGEGPAQARKGIGAAIPRLLQTSKKVRVTLTALPESARAYRSREGDSAPIRLPTTFEIEEGQPAPIEIEVRAEGYIPQTIKLDGAEHSRHVDLVPVVRDLDDAEHRRHIQPGPTPPPTASGAGWMPTVPALFLAAKNAQRCKRPGGPTGTGQVSITIAPNGIPTSVKVEGAPFAGTAVGRCVEGVFHSVRVLPFEGPPFAGSKTFQIPEEVRAPIDR